MPLKYITEDSLRTDEVVENLIVQGEDLEQYYLVVNEEVESVCMTVAGLKADEIPVDAGGISVSPTLRQFARYFALWCLNIGYSGSGYGNRDDVYGQQVNNYLALAEQKRKELSGTVIRNEDGETPINPQDRIRQFFVAV